MPKRPQPPKLAALERAIAMISPAWAAKREASRGMMALSGGYTGATYNERLANWSPGIRDADSDIAWGLRELRSRSSDLIRNSPIAAGAIETQVSHIVGTGLSLQSRIDAEALGMDDDAAAAWQSETERAFELWCDSEFADAHGRLCFHELQDLAFRSHLERGDSFVLLASVNRPGWPYQLALQVIEADLVSNPHWGADTADMVQGIERDASGSPVAVHVSSRHPGAMIQRVADVTWRRIPIRGASGRRNVLHLMRHLRPNQSRGVPCLAPIIEPLKQLTRYSQAEVDAAVNSAALALFAKMDPDTFLEVFDDNGRSKYLNQAQQWDGTLRSGAVVNLLPGEEISNPIQNRPNPNFDPFVQAMLKQVGIGLNIPYEVLLKHFSSSYSAARAALLDAWRTFKIRRTWLAGKLCQPVYEEWLADAVASGRIIAPGFFGDPLVRAAWCGAQWIGDGPGAINPRDEAEAAKVRMEIGLTTLAEEIQAYDGGDWEKKHVQQAREHDERVEAGLAAPLMAPMQPGAGGTMPADAPDKPGQQDTDPNEAPESVITPARGTPGAA